MKHAKHSEVSADCALVGVLRLHQVIRIASPVEVLNRDIQPGFTCPVAFLRIQHALPPDVVQRLASLWVDHGGTSGGSTIQLVSLIEPAKYGVELCPNGGST